MGLDCSHDAFHGAYSAFNNLRRTMLMALGGWGYGHDDSAPDRVGMWCFPEGMDSDTHPGLWELFAHSDCDGDIPPDICALLAKELRVLAPMMRKYEYECWGHILRDGGYEACVIRFAEGCEAAAKKQESLRFR